MGIVILCRIGKLEGLAGNCGDWLRNISLVIHFGIELIIGFLGGFPIRFILTDSDFVDTRIFSIHAALDPRRTVDEPQQHPHYRASSVKASTSEGQKRNEVEKGVLVVGTYISLLNRAAFQHFHGKSDVLQESEEDAVYY